MSSTGEALRRAMSPRAPADLPGLVDVAGSRGELARRMAGIGPGRLPARGTASRTAYDTQMRYLRYAYAEPGSGRRRPYPAASLRRARQAVQPLMRSWYVGQLRRAGARARMHGIVIIAGYVERAKSRTMPRGGPGLFLNRERVEAFTAPGLAGDWAAAGAVFERVFGEAYGVELEMDETTSIQLWPEGSDDGAA